MSVISKVYNVLPARDCCAKLTACFFAVEVPTASPTRAAFGVYLAVREYGLYTYEPLPLRADTRRDIIRPIARRAAVRRTPASRYGMEGVNVSLFNLRMGGMLQMRIVTNPNCNKSEL